VSEQGIRAVATFLNNARAKKHLGVRISRLTDNVVNNLYIILHNRERQCIADNINIDFFVESVFL